jgi:glutamate dehydrogenase
MTHDAMVAYLRKTVKTNEDDLAIFEGMLQFNESVLRTNFFRRDIVALSFRLETSFLAKLYTEVPYGVYMVIGAEFRAFQVRFADVARGGIRLIKSASAAVYNSNLNGLFEECYALAQTQNKKNKDIPEAGSKATILLSLGHQDKATVAFKKFIDGLLDLMLAHARSDVVDYMVRTAVK